jgi:hypothetical protein
MLAWSLHPPGGPLHQDPGSPQPFSESSLVPASEAQGAWSPTMFQLSSLALGLPPPPYWASVSSFVVKGFDQMLSKILAALTKHVMQ